VRRSEPTRDSPSPRPGVRDRILAAGITEFALHDYAGASLERLAEAARTTKPMVHYYFGSKAGLHRTALEHLSARLQTAVALRTQKLTSPPEVLRALVLAAASTEEAGGGALRLLDRSPPTHAPERATSLLADLIRDALKKVLLPLLAGNHGQGNRGSDEETESRTAAIAAALAGAIRSLDPDALASAELLEARAQAIAGLLWHGLASRLASSSQTPPAS
jgi:AcrR family transcriptional regulator